jgi:N-acetylmuramoyl-L-alanine amidase CwlA
LGGKKHWISWHCTVDDKVAIQQLPFNEMAFHAGSEANSRSIAIEICMNEGIDQDTANQRAAEVSALLMKDLNIDLSHVRPHQSWTGKDCPILLLDHGTPGKKWQEFLDLVGQMRRSISTGSELVILKRTEFDAVNAVGNAKSTHRVAGSDGDIDHRLVSDQISKCD